MELYGHAINKGNKLMAYSRYDVSLMKHLIYNYLKQLNIDILNSEDIYMVQSVVSTIDDNITKNNSRVLELTAYSSYQCHESMKPKGDLSILNFSNNDRIHMFEIDESILTETNFYIEGLGRANVVTLENKKHMKTMKCKLGWIKSTNKDKVGF